MFGFTRVASYDYFSHVERALEARFRAAGQGIELHVSDVPPTASVRRRAGQLWGTLVWAGLGDHLDVLGHYRDETPEQRVELRHRDWLTSGSRFNDASFEALMEAVATGMLAG